MSICHLTFPGTATFLMMSPIAKSDFLNEHDVPDQRVSCVITIICDSCDSSLPGSSRKFFSSCIGT